MSTKNELMFLYVPEFSEIHYFRGKTNKVLKWKCIVDTYIDIIIKLLHSFCILVFNCLKELHHWKCTKVIKYRILDKEETSMSLRVESFIYRIRLGEKDFTS
jgi:hypothetical protein